MNEPNDHDSNEPSGAILWLLVILATMAALGLGAGLAAAVGL